MISVTFVSI